MARVLEPTLPRPTMPTLTSCILLIIADQLVRTSTLLDLCPALSQGGEVSLLSGLMILIVGLAVRTLFHFQMAWGAAAGIDRPGIPWRLALVTLALPVSLLIHEGGHWIAGAATGQHC